MTHDKTINQSNTLNYHLMWSTALQRYFEYLSYEKDASVYKINDYKKKFTTISKNLPLPLALTDIRHYLIALKRRGTSPAYINYHITLFNSFIRWELLEGIPQDDFIDKLNQLRPREDRTPDPNDLLSIEEMNRILFFDPKLRPIQQPSLTNHFKKVDEMYSLFFLIQYRTIARSGEVLKLRKRDISFHMHSLTYYDTKDRKRKRTVALHPEIEQMLKSYCSDLNDTDFLFTRNKTGEKPVTQEMVNRAFKYRCKLLGINRPCHVHMLRHSANTHYQMRGCPMSVVKEVGGWRKLSTVELYTHVMIEHQLEALITYDPLQTRVDSEEHVLLKVREFMEGLRLHEFSPDKLQKIRRAIGTTFDYCTTAYTKSSPTN